MKHTFFVILFVNAVGFVACHKKKEPDFSPDFSGVYIGKTNSTSRALQEVFTSPTMSHYVWVSDSVSNKPDTLILTNISVDSFAISGSAAIRLPTEWRTFAVKESTGPSEFSFERHFSLSGYFSRNLMLTFNPSKKTISLNYSSENTQPPYTFVWQFSGDR